MATKVDFYSTYGLKIDQSATGDNTLSVDYANNRVGIQVSANSPRTSLDIGYATDALILPSGNDSNQRPGVPVLGMVRYNTTGNYFEGYDNTGWISVSGKPNISDINGSNNYYYLPFVSSTTGTLNTIYADSGGPMYTSSTLTTPNLSVNSNATVGGTLLVNGNATVYGTLTVANLDELTITTLSTADNFIELGKINNAAPSSATTYELGIAFNYFTTSAKQSAVIWQDNTGFAFVSDAIIPNATQDSTNPQVTVSTAAPIAAQSVYIGTDFTTSTNQVIDSNKNIINVGIDCGTF